MRSRKGWPSLWSSKECYLNWLTRFLALIRFKSSPLVIEAQSLSKECMTKHNKTRR